MRMVKNLRNRSSKSMEIEMPDDLIKEIDHILNECRIKGYFVVVKGKKISTKALNTLKTEGFIKHSEGPRGVYELTTKGNNAIKAGGYIPYTKEQEKQEKGKNKQIKTSIMANKSAFVSMLVALVLAFITIIVNWDKILNWFGG